MKNIFKSIRTVLAVALLSVAGSASAQLYEIANQLPSLIQPALSGSLNYKGYVDAGFSGGVGKYRANVLSVSTSQGFRYSNWFYMGVGIGLDVMFASDGPEEAAPPYGWDDLHFSHDNATTTVFLPLFTDFRFNIGNNPGSMSPSFFIDVKVGASFMLSNKYFKVGDGFITSRENFYLKPSLGIKIPVSKTHPQQAFNVGVTYQLVTSDWWYVGSRNITLNSVGASVGFEW